MPYSYREPDFCDKELPEHLAIAERNVVCPCCGETAEWTTRFTQPGPFNDLVHPDPEFLGWECPACGWDQEATDADWDRKKISDAQQERINAMQARLDAWERPDYPVPSPDEYFDSLDVEGAFEWEAEEAGDWHASEDDDRWDMYALAEDIGRDEDGNRWILCRMVDESGDWDFTDAWDEREGDTLESWPQFYRDNIASQMDDFFRSWAGYWLWCAEHLEDPLGNAIGKSPADPDWVEFCLKGAEDNLRYLDMK